MDGTVGTQWPMGQVFFAFLSLILLTSCNAGYFRLTAKRKPVLQSGNFGALVIRNNNGSTTSSDLGFRYSGFADDSFTLTVANISSERINNITLSSPPSSFFSAQLPNRLTLAAGAEYTFPMRVACTSDDVDQIRTATLSVSGEGDQESEPHYLSVRCRRAQNAVFRQGDSYQFEDTAAGTNSRIFTLEWINNNPDTAKVTGITSTNPSVFQILLIPTLPTPVAPGASIPIQIVFRPPTEGPATGMIVVTYTLPNGVGDQNSSFKLSGNGRAPARLVLLGPDSVGPAVVGTSKPAVYRVRNEGGVTALNVALGIASGSPLFSVDPNQCPTVAPNANCDFTLTFSPQALGPVQGVLSATYLPAGPGSWPVVTRKDLSGNGTTAATLQLEGSTRDYGDVAVGAQNTLIFTLRNALDAHPATELTLRTEPTSQFTITQSSCDRALDTGALCDITVRFQPTADGLVTGAIVASFADGSGPKSLRFAIQGRGVARARLTLVSSLVDTYDFGEVERSTTSSQVLSFRNDGGVPLLFTGNENGTNFQFGWVEPFPGGGTCGSGRLLPGQTCSAAVRFSPDRIGLETDLMALNFSDAVGSARYSFSVRGTGFTPALIVFDDALVALDFGRVRVAAESTVLLATLRNLGSPGQSIWLGSPPTRLSFTRSPNSTPAPRGLAAKSSMPLAAAP